MKWQAELEIMIDEKRSMSERFQAYKKIRRHEQQGEGIQSKIRNFLNKMEKFISESEEIQERMENAKHSKRLWKIEGENE